MVPWPKGVPRSEESRQKQSETRKRLFAEGKLVNPFLGKHHSEKTRRKMSENSAWKGRHFSKDHRRKMSEARKGKSYPHEGHPLSEETRIKISEALKGKPKSEDHIHKQSGTMKRLYAEGELIAWNKGKKCPQTAETLKRLFAGPNSEKMKQKLREARLKRVYPTEDTSIEVLMQDELKRRNIAFKTHVPLLGICQPDIVISEKMIVVQCDGDYWHSKEFKNGEQWRKDRRQDRVLRKAGWTVHRFWGSEIHRDVESCVNQIIGDLDLRGCI